MLLFLLCCTPGVLCFVVVALLVACSRSVAKASSQCSRSVAVCFLAVFSQCCALHVCQHRDRACFHAFLERPRRGDIERQRDKSSSSIGAAGARRLPAESI